MADEPQLSIAESIRAWMRAVVLPIVVAVWTVIGSLWTYYTWYYKEVLIPSTAPVNITTEVTVKEAGSSRARGNESEQEFEAIELEVTATNVSTRTIYFLSNYWTATGAVVNARPEGDAWLESVIEQSANKQPNNALIGRHYELSTPLLVAWANIFPAEYLLYPNESVSRSFLFYVPIGLYDMLDVDLHIPSTSVRKSAEYVYAVDPDGTVNLRVYKIGLHGARTEMPRNAAGEYEDPSIGLQETQSWRQLSLWQSKSSPPATTKPPETSSP